MDFRRAGVKGSNLQLPFHIFPGRVAKQILCMFASACGPGLFAKERELTRYVLNIDHRGIPDRFRIYCFIMSEDSGASRQSGITGLLSGLPGESGTAMHVFSEIAFPPFGYVLAINTPPADKGLLDITPFTHAGFRDFRSLYLPMPVRSVNSYFPADFRSRQEWEDALAARPTRRRHRARTTADMS